MALARNPDTVQAMLNADWEIASHGYRWIDYQHMDEALEREHLERAIAIHREATGSRPLGWYLGRCSPNSHRLAAELGGFVYNADTFDLLYAEGEEHPNMMSIGLHCRPARPCPGLSTFPRPRSTARSSLGVPTNRFRAALAGAFSVG